MTLPLLASLQHEIRADEVKPGDYLTGLGRVQSITRHGKNVTLHSEWDLWKVSVLAGHRVVVVRERTAA